MGGGEGGGLSSVWVTWQGINMTAGDWIKQKKRFDCDELSQLVSSGPHLTPISGLYLPLIVLLCG